MTHSLKSHLCIKQRALGAVGGTVIVLGLLTFSSLVVAGVYAETIYGIGAKPLACQQSNELLLMKGNIFRKVNKLTKS